jgi:hypothetical protein
MLYFSMTLIMYKYTKHFLFYFRAGFLYLFPSLLSLGWVWCLAPNRHSKICWITEETLLVTWFQKLTWKFPSPQYQFWVT